MRQFIQLTNKLFEEHDSDEYGSPKQCKALLRAVKQHAKILPIHVVMKLYKNQYTSEIQGVVLTDLYADHPGQGAGTKVMRHMCDLADRLGVNIYTDAEGPQSKAFYLKFGFESDRGRRHMLVRYPPLPNFDDDDD